jgi:hypothetical protein
MKTREISWSEFCTWVVGKKVAKEIDDPFGNTKDRVILEFEDGSMAEIISNYEGPWSEYTPGNGIEPPTVQVSE